MPRFAPLLVLLLLAGCGSPAALTPTSTPRATTTPLPTVPAVQITATPGGRPTSSPGGTGPTPTGGTAPAAPSPTARILTPPAATPVPGEVALRAVLAAFNLALISGNSAEAQGYFTPPLRARVPPQNVWHALGLTTAPRRYAYRILAHSGGHAGVALTYRTAGGGSVRDRLSMVETDAGWRIAGIHPG
ncbi:MAG TPA: hypothetical protein VFB58_10920 [Chloroflexota bacterium]|nr:hypothetical protein [Chloroflexota bacterium]